MKNNVGLFLSKRAHLNPDLEAIVDTGAGRRLSFEALNRRANRVADLAADLGVNKGDRVTLLMLNCSEYVEIFLVLQRSARSSCRSIGAWSPTSSPTF